MAEGLNVAVFVLLLTFTVPAMAAPFVVFTSVKLAVLSEEFFIASEKVADTDAFSTTPVAPLVGDMATTVGGVVSGTAAVVKLHGKLATIALPAASFAAVVMVAVY